MDKIVDELSKVRFSDSDKLEPESFFIRIKLYYQQYQRHKYSEISKVVYEFKDDSIDILRINLSEIKEMAYEDGSLDVSEKIDKLIDHADLAEYQRKLIEDVGKEQKVLIEGFQRVILHTRKKLSDTKSELEIAKTELNKTKEEIDASYNKVNGEIGKLKEDTSSIYTQFVTILGIFTAIIIGVFGGMEILGNVMSNIENVKVTKLLMFSSLMMGAIITIIYLLLISIAGLTDKPIRNCGCSKGTECRHSVFKKHPIYIIGMMSSLYLFIIGTIAHGFGTNNLKGMSFLDNLMNNGYSIIVVAILLLVVFMFAFIPLFRSNDNEK